MTPVDQRLNQCMGCQAGWPTREPRLHVSGNENELALRRAVVHEVQDGYPNEVVGCTAWRYL
jgi:hypothetical protein